MNRYLDRWMGVLFFFILCWVSGCAEDGWNQEVCGQLIISEPVACVCPPIVDVSHSNFAKTVEHNAVDCRKFVGVSAFCEELKSWNLHDIDAERHSDNRDKNLEVAKHSSNNKIAKTSNRNDKNNSINDENNKFDETSCIDINHASIKELMRLPGIGQGRAELIVASRNKKPFKRRSDITRIKGIGKKSYKKMENYICRIE